LDAVIQIIRSSQSAYDDGLAKLREQFGFSEEQGKAILDMRLARLAALERQKIEDELQQLLKNIAYYNLLLSNINEIRNLIKADLEELKEKYGDPRRTEIINVEASEFSDEDLIPTKRSLLHLQRKATSSVFPPILIERSGAVVAE
jgi:DNA gyrase subunit A